MNYRDNFIFLFEGKFYLFNSILCYVSKLNMKVWYFVVDIMIMNFFFVV